MDNITLLDISNQREFLKMPQNNFLDTSRIFLEYYIAYSFQKQSVSIKNLALIKPVDLPKLPRCVASVKFFWSMLESCEYAFFFTA